MLAGVRIYVSPLQISRMVSWWQHSTLKEAADSQYLTKYVQGNAEIGLLFITFQKVSNRI